MKHVTYLIPQTKLVSAGQALCWSALRRIGSLPLMRAVMFAPLISYLILFNDYVIDFLNQVSKNSSIIDAGQMSLSNVYFLYYGLISVGVAAIIYGLFCPNGVSRYADNMDFANAVRSVMARTMVNSIFDDVLGRFVEDSKRGDAEEREPLDYPQHIRDMTARLVIEIYKRYLADDTPIENPAVEEEDDDWVNFHQEFHTGSGYFVAEAIADRAYRAPKVLWAFSEPYLSIGVKEFSADIAVTKYEIDNHSWPLIRFITAFLYAFGFALMFIPSIKIFITISALLVI